MDALSSNATAGHSCSAPLASPCSHRREPRRRRNRKRKRQHLHCPRAMTIWRTSRLNRATSPRIMYSSLAGRTVLPARGADLSLGDAGLNMYGMKEGSEKVFGKGYNVLPVFKQRLNAKTLITTPNSDVIYALGYLDLKEDGPLVIEVPPGLQGILDDFFQRPICSVGVIDGRDWSGDVGLPGPDKGKGGKYLVLPPDYKGEAPPGYFTYRSRTNGVFVFWRGFFKDPKQLEEPVKVIEQTRIYPLGKKDSAKPMQFPDASGVPANMLYPQDGSAFDMLARFIEHEYVDPADMEMRGMAAALGIVKGKPFAPTPAA